jgi:CBS domain containing-hemolysin-like protein
MIHAVLDMEELSVREIMKPRHDIVSVPLTATLDEVLETMVTSQHSRLPVWEDAPEHIVGIVFFKDMLRIWRDRRASVRAGRPAGVFEVRRFMRKPIFAPETKPLLQTLSDLRQKHHHMALVIDEFGTITGLVTVEDILEQIVGEIEDEYDEALPPPEAEASRVEIDGATSVRDFASIYGLELPAEAGFETIAGYMLYELGHIPKEGESVRFDGRRFTVTAMDRHRIAKVLIERLDEAPEPGKETADAAPAHSGSPGAEGA